MSEGGHEIRDVAPKRVVQAGVGFFTLLTVSALLMALLLRYYTHRSAEEQPPPSPIAAREVPPAPRLQVEARKDLQALHAEEDALLDGYGWVNRPAGTVRIPIDRAMALLVERGAAGARR